MMTSSIPRLFIAGLGNLPFPNTRHSIGHVVIDGLAQRLGIRLSSCRGGFTGKGKVFIGPDRLVELTLYKSKSLMNISGHSIVQAYRQFLSGPNSSPSQPLIVLADSLSHRPLAISPKFAGSANGHNGVKNIIAAFGGMGFYRLRLGIGTNKGEGGVDAADYVMASLSRKEVEWWTGDGLDTVLDEIQQIASKIKA